MTSEPKYSIRFGLSAIKAVGASMIDSIIEERESSTKFENIEDMLLRIDPKAANKKMIEALAKSGSTDSLHKNRRQIFESSDIISSYSSERKKENDGVQTTLFAYDPSTARPPINLKPINDWDRTERLSKEFESFGFFLNEHPIDEHLQTLKELGIITSSELETTENDESIGIAGVIITIRHKSNSRGRFSYMTISDPTGIIEASIFDEALIVKVRDLLVEGSAVVCDCLIKNDSGGIRVLIKDMKSLNDFLKNPKKFERKISDKSEKRQTSKDNKLVITLSDVSGLVDLKQFLDLRIDSNPQDSFSVILNILKRPQSSRILLKDYYRITEEDLIKIEEITGIKKVKKSS